MKKNVLLLLIITLISCSAEEIKIPHSNIIIAGKVRNYDPDNPSITIGVNRISLGKVQISSKIDQEGNFKIAFESKIPTDIWLKYKANFLILTHPGDSIYVEFDGSKDNRYDLLKSVSFKGDFSNENAKAAKFQKDYFFLGYYSTKGKIYEFAEKYDHIKYKQLRDSIRIIEIANLKRFIRKYKPTTETENWARAILDLDYFRDMSSYTDHHQIGRRANAESLSLPISYYDFMKDHFSINDSNLISGYAISSFVNLYPIYLLELAKDRNKPLFESIETIKKSHKAIDSLIFYGAINDVKDPLLRQMVLTEILRQRLEQSQIDMFNQHEKIISEIVTKPFLKEPLFELYNQTINSLNNPENLSNSIYQNLSGKPVKSEMDKIIASNKGKVIYMDCWATWCGPCIAELPQSKRLIDQYKAKEVSFLFICLDSEKKDWESIISKNSLEGQHIYLDKNQSQEFRESFKIKGIPHYILIDRQGRIIENGTQPIKDKLDRLLTSKK
jgi:thiol-disulfide isomerase/thioredoxin